MTADEALRMLEEEERKPQAKQKSGVLHNINLWLEYNDTYIKLQRHKFSRRAMSGHPGCRFMLKGWLIVWFFLALLCLYGASPLPAIPW